MTAPGHPGHAGRTGRAGRAVRLTANPEEVGRGLGQVVVVLLELLRDLLERQAVRRMDSGALPTEQVEELGQALIEVRDAIAQVRDSLGVSAEQARAATARARGLLGEWPPSGYRDQPARVSPAVRASPAARVSPAARAARAGIGRASPEGRAGRRGERGGKRADDVRWAGLPAVGNALGTGRRHHERGRPAPHARDVAPPGWDLP